MADRLNSQELKDFLEAQLPPVGTVVNYRDWHAQIAASEHPEAIRFYTNLKREGKVKPSLTANDDGTTSHMIERVG